ncbi:MAG: response regulator transcription factor [Glaciimonas sp.]|nr:response regulator transcription factor [Glaciimonas sp.]
MARLLLIKNKTIQQEEQVKFLQANHHLVADMHDLCSFQQNPAQKIYHIAIVDLMPNIHEKLDFVRKLRRENPAIGIIILSDDFRYFVESMEAGADNFHGNPAQYPELLACVNSLARRLGFNPLNEPWVIDEKLRVLISPEGSSIALSARDYFVLRTLIAGHGQTVTRRQIVSALDEDFMAFDQRRLDTQIRRLRVKAEKHFGCKLPVNTVHGIGYVFSAAAVIRY